MLLGPAARGTCGAVSRHRATKSRRRWRGWIDSSNDSGNRDGLEHRKWKCSRTMLKAPRAHALQNLAELFEACAVWLPITEKRQSTAALQDVAEISEGF